MSERKVLNKYFPPNFDPSLIKRRKMPKDRQQVVRLMAPFSMRCTTCGEYIYKGKKFNARKETVEGEEYYGIKIFRFYIKCTQCSAEITFKTDPKNTDYVAEHGAARNFEPWREENPADEEDRLARLEEEENDPMAALESKALDSKREMDILDGLQELKSRNARIERAGKEGSEKFLDRVSSGLEVGDREVTRKLTEFEEQRKREEEEDEEEIRKVFGRAYMDGVPDIELEEGGGASSSEDDGEGPTTPRDGEDAAGPGPSSIAAAAAVSTASVKRKLEAVEPTPADLLSAASKSIVEKSFPMAPPKKKGKNNALANKLGIKLKGK
ncbi:CWC16 protein family protein [Pseudohyphozyma bogoriensis]|nr:CWC16 protein family protein [Pseudohyphozyma bogoriensis]